MTAKPGVLGVISVGGFPGAYRIQLGLTGPTLAHGSPEEILRALAAELRHEDGSAVEISFPARTSNHDECKRLGVCFCPSHER